MATYTATVSQCSGGGHVTLTLKKDGVAFRSVSVLREDMNKPDNLTFEEILYVLVRQTIVKAGATTPAQIKTAIEAASCGW